MSALPVLLAVLAPQGDDAAALSRVLQALRERVAPSVVSIEITRSSDPEGEGGVGRTASQREYMRRPEGPCTGVIYSADGLILTSQFNVSGEIRPGGLRVRLHDGRELEARLLGWHQGRDIALLQVEAKGLPVLPKADVSTLAPGRFLALVGRAPDPVRPTINLGILSALNRVENSAVQTDAEMNYGNAGGALVTLRGALVGVACHVRPGKVWGQSSGVGFACKTAEIDRLLDRLRKGERIEAEPRPFLGIRPGEGNPDVEGTQVGEVIAGSPAEKAGLKKDDVIVAVDDRPVTDFESLRAILMERHIGEKVTVKVRRPKGKALADRAFAVTLGGRPEE